MNSYILIVDDDAVFCRVLGHALQRRHMNSIAAHSVEAAITLVNQEKFTHAIVDLNLGSGDSGLSVLRHLAIVQPKCQSLMLTGFASIATAVEATKSGAVQYLPKPASVDEILASFSMSSPESDPVVPEHPPTPKRLEWEYIQRTLFKNRGNISATARELGMHRRTLQRKLAKKPPAH